MLLDELREKQRRLKAEYDAMEEQLIAMEASLGVQASGEAGRRPRKTLDSVEQDDAGNVTFRCVDTGLVKYQHPVETTVLQVWPGWRNHGG